MKVGTLYRLLSVAVMVGAVLAVTLPPLAPEAWRMDAAVLAFLLGVVAYVRFRTPAGGRVGAVFLGLAFLCLSFAVPTPGGLSGGLIGAGAVFLVNSWAAKPGEGGKGGRREGVKARRVAAVALYVLAVVCLLLPLPDLLAGRVVRVPLYLLAAPSLIMAGLLWKSGEEKGGGR